MTHVERDIFVNAPPEEIAAYAMNPNNTPEWYEGVVEVNPDYETPVVGGKNNQVYTAAGNRMEMTLTVIEYEPNRVIAFEMDGMVSGTLRWIYTPQYGGTHVQAVIDYEMSGGLLGKIADKLVVERMNVSQLEKSLENLKAKAEG